MNIMYIKNYVNFLDYVKAHYFEKEDAQEFRYRILEIDEKLMKIHINAWKDFFENMRQYIDNTDLCNAVAEYIIFHTTHYLQAKDEKYYNDHYIDKCQSER